MLLISLLLSHLIQNAQEILLVYSKHTGVVFVGPKSFFSILFCFCVKFFRWRIYSQLSAYFEWCVCAVEMASDEGIRMKKTKNAYKIEDKTKAIGPPDELDEKGIRKLVNRNFLYAKSSCCCWVFFSLLLLALNLLYSTLTICVFHFYLLATECLFSIRRKTNWYIHI